MLDIQNEKGLSNDQIDELKSICIKTADENIGMPSVFMVTSGMQEWLQENNIPGQDGSMYSGNYLPSQINRQSLS